MPNRSRRPITVVGAGFMGTVIATLYARHGYPVVISDLVPGALDTFRERARPIAESLADGGASADNILDGVAPVVSLEHAVAGSFLVHEAIHEHLEAKQSLFAALDRICQPDVVLATNTSSFRLSEICRDVRLRDRVIGIHYITPAHVIRIVELVTADFTPKKLVDWGIAFLKTIDHVGVACTETPGFLVNRLQYAMLSEAYRIVQEGVASCADVDKVFRLSLGPRLALWGPLLTEDLVVSKKTAASVWDYLFATTGLDKFRRPEALDGLVETGRLGALTGAGWYDFDRDYASIVASRDRQLKTLLDWLAQNDRQDEFKAS